MRMQPTFGNGGAVETLISTAILNMERRKKPMSIVDRAKDVAVTGIDINPDWNGGTCLSGIDIPLLLQDMIGAESLVQQFQSYQLAVEFSDKRGKSRFSDIPMCFKFLGPSGCGKTTVARKIGKLYYDLGLLPTDKVVEASATDLIGQFIGSTAIKTRDKVTSALGSVLFIDEAYRLNGSKSGAQFAKEALDELVDLITKPEFMNKIVIVLAGYSDEIEELMKTNPGLASRFAEKVVFNPISPDMSCVMLANKLKSDQIVIGDFALVNQEATLIFSNLINKTNGWGNGRDIETMAKEIKRLVAQLCVGVDIEPGEDIVLTSQQLIEYMRRFYLSREQTAVSKKPIIKKNDDHLFDIPEPMKLTAPKTKTAAKIEELEDSSDSDVDPIDNSNDGRDPGVSDESWLNLQEAKKRAIKEEADQLQKSLLNKQILEKAERDLRIEEETKEREMKLLDEAEKIKKERYFLRKKKVMLDIIKAKQAILDKHEREEKERQEKEEARKKKLEKSGRCPAGYAWVSIGEGAYQCTGMSYIMVNLLFSWRACRLRRRQSMNGKV